MKATLLILAAVFAISLAGAAVVPAHVESATTAFGFPPRPELERHPPPPLNEGSVGSLIDSLRADGPSFPCIGDGVSGNRVQAIYAYYGASGDRYAERLPEIRRRAKLIDTYVDGSAAQTGGTRHIRYVTDANCQLDVKKVLLKDPSFDFNRLKQQIRETGPEFHRSDRKYLVWTERTNGNGIADVSGDDRPTSDNVNNSGNMYAEAPATSPAQSHAHELMHMLGAVHRSAPHSTPGGHCTEHLDLMCYDDDGNGPVTTRTVCGEEMRDRFDCNHDDYFHTSLAAGSYLATHWNTANSSFLARTDILAPGVQAPRTRILPDFSREIKWSAFDRSGVVAYELRKRSLFSSSAVPLPSPTATSVIVSGAVCICRFSVRAKDGAGNWSPWVAQTSVPPAGT